MNQQEPQIKKLESFTLHSPAPLLGFRFFVFSYTIGENPNTSLECGLETFTLDPKLNPLPGWSQSCLQLFLNGLLHFRRLKLEGFIWNFIVQLGAKGAWKIHASEILETKTKSLKVLFGALFFSLGPKGFGRYMPLEY